jgi:hypothetical protein
MADECLLPPLEHLIVAVVLSPLLWWYLKGYFACSSPRSSVVSQGFEILLGADRDDVAKDFCR